MRKQITSGKYWKDYSDRIAMIDCSKCPKDFQEAFANLSRSASAFAGHLNALTAISGAIDTLHGNASEISKINDLKADYESSMTEVKRVAVQHGVTFQ